jgi:hypothetical protein
MFRSCLIMWSMWLLDNYGLSYMYMIYPILKGWPLLFVTCNLNTKVHQIMWTKLNDMMLKHGFPKPNFKGFMVDNAQANWNTIRIVYGLRELSTTMVDKECTCLFHLTQSLNRHIDQLIKLELQDCHVILCHNTRAQHLLGRLIVSMLQFIIGGFH